MSGPDVTSAAVYPVLALALLALALFVAASQTGRWTLWLLGYLVALAALVLAMPAAPVEPDGGHGVAEPYATEWNPGPAGGFTFLMPHRPDRRLRS